MTIFVNILKALTVWYAKKHLIELMVDAAIEAADEVSKKTKTELDDDAVAKLKEDKAEIMAVITKYL